MKVSQIWRDLSVSTKLYFVVGIMGLLIATELLTLRFAMGTLSSVRAFVGGEGLWSKGQKTSVIALRRYTDTHDEHDYQDFLKAIEVPLGDHQARIGLMQPKVDLDAVYDGFAKGHIHHDDIPGVVNLVRRFNQVPYLAKALKIWADADNKMQVLVGEADQLHNLILQKRPVGDVQAQLRKLEVLNDQFTIIEDEFSFTLGEGSRWLEHLVMKILLALVLTVESTGLFLTISFSRHLSKSLIDLCEAAARVGRGIFSEKIPVNSKDELGRLAASLNSMTDKLQETTGSRQQAERANETKSAFLANMSHEIRTPLGAILGFAEVMKDPNLAAEERLDYLGIVERNGKALMRVIDDILDLSKVEAGRLAIEQLEFSLPSLVEDVVHLFLASASVKGIALDLTIEPNAKKAICSDPTRMRQILANLIGNALKFTAKGSVYVWVKIVNQGPDEIVQIQVRDTGLGLRPEEREKLFSAFTQADESTSRKFGGTGLGLVLSRKLAQALGGNVYIAESIAGVGSTFVIEVKNRKPNAEIHSLETSVKKLGAENGVKGAKVLVVEDSPDIQALLKFFLKRNGVQADFASNGLDGIKFALNDSYDMVFLDIQMPGLDGYDVLAHLREKNYTAPVIALTAHAMKEDRERSQAAGFSEHLTKPIDEASLINAIYTYSHLS